MTTKCKEKFIRIRKALVGLLVLLLASGVFAGCEGEIVPEKTAKDTIRIAIMEPLSGSESDYAKAEQQGIALANRLRSYVLDQKIELVSFDNKSSLTGAKAAAEEIVKAGCIAAMGSYGNMLTLAAADTLEEAEIPLINITGSNPLLSGASAYVFRAASVETDQATAIGTYLLSENSTIAALVPYDNDYATTLTDELGLVVGYSVPVVTYLPGTTDFSVQIDALRSCNVSAVFLPGEIDDVVAFLAQAKGKWSFIGTEKLKNSEFLEKAGTTAEGMLMTGEWDPEISYTKTSDIFLEFYRMIRGAESMPTEAEALGFEAYMLLLHAIESLGEDGKTPDAITGSDIQKAILNTKDFNGVTGVLSVNPEGDFKRDRTVWMVKNGTFINTKNILREKPIVAEDEE